MLATDPSKIVRFTVYAQAATPVTIKEGAPKDEAADIQKQIEEGGAKVELK